MGWNYQPGTTHVEVPLDKAKSFEWDVRSMEDRGRSGRGGFYASLVVLLGLGGCTAYFPSAWGVIFTGGAAIVTWSLGGCWKGSNSSYKLSSKRLNEDFKAHERNSPKPYDAEIIKEAVLVPE